MMFKVLKFRLFNTLETQSSLLKGDGKIMSFLWFLIIGGIIGWLAGLILGKDIPGGVIGNIIAGIVGAWIGGMLLGSWGPKVSDFYLVPAIIGAVVLVFIVSLIMKSMRKAS